MNTIALAATKLYVAMDGDPVNAKPVMPPGMGSLATIVSWLLWIAGVALFALFISGIVKAARARHQQGQVDAEAPMWPLVWAVVLGAAGTIWRVIVPG
ncbi:MULTISPECIES: hypothetical protein [Sinomonas]|uniref:Uncharacterized protein n=1 Tax=Sinomonas humi TaxID=1338436 RepID=A0A0B2AES8_9MICC|nr:MULTISPECIES: hypothetical protein [Sinomonas]KHL01750.1 hypothetical protein LK10_14845 [Sinomonas humi]MDQ4504454.1 hypothetical protein [Sinomonas sp. ASV322]